MSDSSFITARESPGGPPPGVDGKLSKLWWAARNPPIDPTVSFEGKTVLVTGANTGLGFEAAVKYAALGASKLILGVRSIDKGEAAKKEVVRRTGYTNPIIILTVDLGEFESVKSFIQALEKETPHLDVALLNAGLTNPSFVKSSAGWELALQVNILSTALMAIMLLPILRGTAASKSRGTPHLSFVNSIAHADVKPEWYTGSLLQATNDEAAYDAQRSYAMVKLLGMAVMQAVASKTRKSSGEPQIIVNACCPYMCKTDLGRNYSIMAKIPMMGFQAVFARTAEEGARTLVSATALGPESHGRFWHHDILHPIGDVAKNDGAMQQSWSEILQVIAEVLPDAEIRL
ncbi:hypothetical protein G7Y79_00039g076240 [Neofusicoccum parvum]|nr:hypothetical protein G7Y79_00039g076240 [Neofusicoccum parvum]